MSDAQWLLIILGVIYLSDCLVWLRRDAIAIVIPLRGRAFVRRSASWAGNERGGLAFLTLLPARAVFVCDATKGGNFRLREIDQRVGRTIADTSVLRMFSLILFVLLFAVAPALAWRFTFERIGLDLIAAFVVFNAAMAILFFRAHRRIDRDDAWHRWTHAIVMLVATPSAVRAIDQTTRSAMREHDPLAVAAHLAGTEDPIVKTMLREFAHPLGGVARDSRYDAARKAGFVHVEEPPAGASAYCPRCLSLYAAGTSACADCGIVLLTM
ncbi:MAG TPA: hypothetical protein VGQ76_06410 [Thermoanaerobaculia bacterium]|jgi:hypothetical protein|nr:hypothetical protein [Thermoanaerobaculia bacterium]